MAGRKPTTGATKAASRPTWEVILADEFEAKELASMDLEQRKAFAAAALALQSAGPGAGRPLIGTLDNPKHPNMKELRYDAHDGNEVWRAAFAFDPDRKAIVLVAGDKQGKDQEQFYKQLLKKANKRYDQHLESLRPSKRTPKD